MSHGTTDFNLAAKMYTPDEMAEKTVKPEPAVQMTAPDPNAGACKATIHHDRTLADDAEIAGENLQLASSGGGLFAEMFGMACDKLSAGMGVVPVEPRMEVAPQPDMAEMAHRAVEMEETKWTQRADLENNFKPTGPGMGGMSA